MNQATLCATNWFSLERELAAIAPLALDQKKLAAFSALGGSPDMLRKQLTIIGSWTFSWQGQANCARLACYRPGSAEPRFRTFQVCPKDLPAPPPQAARAENRAHGPVGGRDDC